MLRQPSPRDRRRKSSRAAARRRSRSRGSHEASAPPKPCPGSRFRYGRGRGTRPSPRMAWVGTYSHGMHKRLSVARALLTHPAILLVDEATHDLDPEGARRIRALISAAAGEGAGVIWATQRVEEIRGFADRVTLLHRGEVRFAGSVARLMATSPARRYLLHLRDGNAHPPNLLVEARAALAGGLVSAGPDPEHLLLALPEAITLGEAVTSLVEAGLDVLACCEEGSGVE